MLPRPTAYRPASCPSDLPTLSDPTRPEPKPTEPHPAKPSRIDWTNSTSRSQTRLVPIRRLRAGRFNRTCFNSSLNDCDRPSSKRVVLTEQCWTVYSAPFTTALYLNHELVKPRKEIATWQAGARLNSGTRTSEFQMVTVLV